MFGRIQDLIKDGYTAFVINGKTEINTKESLKGKFDVMSQIDNEFKDKSEKIKVFILKKIFT